MKIDNKNILTIDSYIKTFPKEVQSILEEIRKTIKEVVPAETVETISYQMPSFKLKGKYVVYFAAWKSHIGFYATPGGNTAFQKELAPYKQAKGSIQFPLDEPMPFELIKKIAKFRVKEIQENKK